MAAPGGYEPITNSTEMFDSRPLFGVPTRRNRLVNWAVAGVTSAFVLETLISSVSFHQRGATIFYSLCLLFVGAAQVILIHWYRQGDLEPKFLRLIYFNAVLLNLLCLCGNLFIYQV